jgi:hypothetical protein
MTDFETMCEILAEFWSEYRDDNNLKEFVSYNDLGLPLAYFINESIVVATPASEAYINETFNFLIGALAIDDQVSYESLDEMFDAAAELEK